MPYRWKTETKPEAPFDGQIHVDNFDKIYRYSSGNVHSWIPYDRAKLTYVDQYIVQSKNHPITKPLANLVKDLTMPDTWPTTFAKSFVEIIIHDGSTEITRYYFAQLTWSELETVIRSVVPSSGGIFEALAYIKVYDIIDSGITCGHFSAFNNIYGSTRGQDYYRYTSERAQWNVDSSFLTSWTGVTNLANTLMNLAFSLTPLAANDNRAIWFSANRRGPYHFPKIGVTTCQPAYARWAYNSGTDTYESTTGLSWSYQAPVIFGVRRDGESNMDLYLGSGPTYMRGNNFLEERQSAIAFFPLVSGNYRALAIKPYGVTHLIIDKFDTSTFTLFGENQFSGYGHPRHRSLETYIQYWGDNAFKVFIHNCFMYPSISAGHGIDYAKIPTGLRLYLRNKRTGVRSEYLNGKIDLVRRRPFMAQGFLHSRETHKGI